MLSNFGVVLESEEGNKLYRSAMPDWDGYADLHQFLGVGHCFKLNAGDDWVDHPLYYGQMEYTRIPMRPDRVDQAQIRVIVNEIHEKLKETSVLVHCTFGRDRTGVVIAAYRMIKQGWTFEEAHDEMKEFAGGIQRPGHMPFFDRDFLEFLQGLEEGSTPVVIGKPDSNEAQGGLELGLVTSH